MGVLYFFKYIMDNPLYSSKILNLNYKNSAFINNNKILLMLLYLYKYQILDNIDKWNLHFLDIDILSILLK